MLCVCVLSLYVEFKFVPAALACVPAALASSRIIACNVRQCYLATCF